jgi:hypothetical protein
MASSTSTSTWKFERDGIKGFLSAERASSDALSALAQWQSEDPRRSFKIVSGEESETEMVAELSTDAADSNSGASLDTACAKHSVSRTRV